MSDVSEALERAEHVKHAGHGGGQGREIGLTIAILGVLLAFCGALVGSERTELVKTMVEQSNTANDYEAESTRYRTTLAQVEALNSVSQAESEELTKEIDAIGANSRPENAEVMLALRNAVRVQLAQTGPDAETIARLVHLARAHQRAAATAKDWTDSYEPVVRAHYEAAEGFERSQVAIEVAIVLASIALLLYRRWVWVGSVGLGLVGIAFMVMTYLKTHPEIQEGVAKIAEAQKRFEQGHEDGKKESDEEVLRQFEKDYKLAPVGALAPVPAPPALAPTPATAPVPAPPAPGGEEN